MSAIFNDIRKAKGWGIMYGYDPRYEINIHANARKADVGNYRAFRGVHLVRDPRDVIVSGYYSHKKTHPIKEWKALADIRESLNRVSMDEGLYLEIDFLEPHFRDMYEWEYNHPDILELKYEDVTMDPDLGRIFDHLGFVSKSDLITWSTYTLQCVLNKMNNRGLWPWRYHAHSLPHSRQRMIVTKNSFENLSGGREKGQEDTGSHYRKGVHGDWRNHLTPEHLGYFHERYGGLLERLGYS